VSPPPTTPAWHIAKLVLGGVAIVSSIILIALAASTWGVSEGYAFELVYIVPVAGVALCWQIAEFITLGARGGLSRYKNSLGRGIHPGAHVGMHLVLWMGFAVDLGIEAFTAYYLDEYVFDSDPTSYGSSYYNAYSWLAGAQYRDITRSLTAFSAISLAVHFILFVRACIETHARNTAKRMDNIRYIYVQQPVYYQQAGPNGSFAPPPPMMHQQQQPQQPQPTHYSGVPSTGYYGPQYPQQQQQQITGQSSNAAGPEQNQASSAQ